MTVKRSFKLKKSMTGGMARNFHPWSKDKEPNWNEGDYVIGKYVASTVDNYKHDCPILEVMDYSLSYPVLNKNREEVEIMDKNLQLNHCGTLAYAFYGESEKGKEAIELGQIVQVTYMGKEVLEKGPYKGKESHKVQVDIMTEEAADDDIY
jgi:hypothetical protein